MHCGGNEVATRKDEKAPLNRTIDSAIKSAIISAVKGAVMSYVTANELKRNGVSVVKEAVAEYGEAIVSVRGKDEYIIMNTERYNHLRECELDVALMETRKAIEAGDFVDESTEEHIARIRKYV